MYKKLFMFYSWLKIMPAPCSRLFPLCVPRQAHGAEKRCAVFGTRAWLYCAGLLTFALLAPCSAALADEAPLRVGVMGDRPPLSYTTAHGELQGLAVDLPLALNTALHRETVFLQGSIPQLLEMLHRGELDYLCGLSLPEPLDAQLTYIPSSFSMNRRILVAHQNLSIKTEDDFYGHTILLVQADAAYGRVVRARGGTPIIAKNTPEALQKLSAGQADAFVTSMGEVAINMVQELRLPGIALIGLSLQRTSVGIILKNDGSPLLTQLTGELTEMEQAGELEKLREKWLGRTIMGEPSFWERYKEHLVYGFSSLLLLLVLVGLWNFSLRRRVATALCSLNASEKRYRTLTEASPDMVLLADEQGQLWFANKAARQVLGLPALSPLSAQEELPSRALLDSLDKAGVEKFEALASKALEGHIVWEEFHLRLGYKVSSVELTAFHAASEHEGAALICCVGRDLSVRRNMESELARSDRLAIIGRLAAGVTHEVSNPLGIILANAEYLRSKGSSPQLEAIVRNVERASKITSRLLHLAVDQEGESRAFNMNEVVTECLSFLKPRLNNVTVLVDVPEALPAWGERALLEQLLLNLMLNALESMENTGTLQIIGRTPAPEAQSAESAEAPHAVTLTVKDSGPGIPRENLERVFDIFFSTKGREGFGLGLFVARSIAEQHGGLLWAESEVGKGASFVLELPGSSG